MSVQHPIPPTGDGPLRTTDDPTLRGWYLDKPATLRVSDPFLVVRADNAEVVFPRREFRFEVIGPSPTRAGTQQLMFIGDAMNVIFETPFEGGWERFIESVPPELVVTPEAAHLEAAGLTPPPPIGLRLGELDMDEASPPPPSGPMLAHEDGTPVTVEVVADERDAADGDTDVTEVPVPRIVLSPDPVLIESDIVRDEVAADVPPVQETVPEETVVDDLVDSIARRDLELSDLDLEADADADLEMEETLRFDQHQVLEERDPAELDGLVDVDEFAADESDETPVHRTPLIGAGADDAWNVEIAPVVRRAVSVVVPVVRVVAPIVIVSQAVTRLRDGATVLDRLFDVALALGLATVVVLTLGALLTLVRPADDGFSMFTSLDDRLTRSARRVGLGCAVVGGLMVAMALLGRWLDPGLTWSKASWVGVALVSAVAVSAACSVRAADRRTDDDSAAESTETHDMEEAR